ncbi:unnamed protein product [Symbiodinium natans]|uniref:Uncharacterized protein n=1 Tax=Symbiodinium natans TaxID=878477 RepID=A0A812KVR2_9DINO|nr:unnamed protein product [Symbiodinium natans]
MEGHRGCWSCLWPWKLNPSGQVGGISRGQVSRLLEYGAVITFETSEGRKEGWLHPSHLSASRNGPCFVKIVGPSGAMLKLAVHLEESAKASPTTPTSTRPSSARATPSPSDTAEESDEQPMRPPPPLPQPKDPFDDVEFGEFVQAAPQCSAPVRQLSAAPQLLEVSAQKYRDEAGNSALQLTLFPGLLQRLSPYLQVQGYTQLRATGSSVGSVLHKKALISHLLCLMQPERPDVFAAAGEWCKETNRSERFWDDLGWKGSTLKAGKEGIWAFFRALKKWRKMEPTIMLPVAKNLKSHCCHPEPEIANNAQRIMAVCAGCLFSIRGQGPAVKSIRHLFARDMIYWLQHADDDDRADICGELSRCGPHLLGRFNKACAAELVEACKPGNGDVCRSNARKALTVFVENDAALHPFVWPLIEELRWALPPDEKREIHRMRARILLTGACQSASDAWHAGLAAKKMVSKALQDCFQACPSCT